MLSVVTLLLLLLPSDDASPEPEPLSLVEVEVASTSSVTLSNQPPLKQSQIERVTMHATSASSIA